MNAIVSPASKPAHDFRKVLRRSLLLTARESQAFDELPDDVFESIFRHNFNGNLALAERVLFNRYSGMERVDRARLEQEKLGIHNLAKATKTIVDALAQGRDVLFVTDNDNDGSLAQAILIEFVKCLPESARAHVHVEYAQPIGATRGLTLEIVEKSIAGRGWQDGAPFVVVTADNGINNRVEQARIEERYPNASLIVTDHHLPDDEKVILENERSLVFNPKYRPSEYFKRKNISGANTLGVLLTSVVKEFQERSSPGTELSVDTKLALSNMDEIGLWANLLDYANSDIADMPNRPYTIEKALALRPLLNVSTSMSNLVTGAIDESAIDDISAASGGKLSADWLRAQLADVAALNRFSKKLLSLYHRTLRANSDGSVSLVDQGKSDFYDELSREIVREDSAYESINPNYIEQLRPIIFNLTAIDNKPVFMALLSDTMVQAFEQLRRQERSISDELRKVGLLREDRRPSSAILYPVHPSVTRLFNRRLLGKAYNNGNDGFVLILSKLEGGEASGSMRSLYPITEILQGKEEIEKKLSLRVEFLGHEMAAGFNIYSTNGADLTESRLAALNDWLDNRVTALKMEERVNQLTNIDVDFASVGLMTKINSAVKANLAGMRGMPAVMRFSADGENQVWVTDPETGRQMSLVEIVQKKRFGYQAIATSFKGEAIVVPVELLRAVVESNYAKGIRLSYMDEGVFMAFQVVEPDLMPNVKRIRVGRADQEKLAQHYVEHHKQSHFVPLSREDFESLPYFRYNRYGSREFENWENTIIALLDATGQDVLAVIDTEGTGLGKAPKCFNIGGTNVRIAPESGKTMGQEEFEAGYYRDAKGREYLLTPRQIGALKTLGSEEAAPEGAVVLHKVSLDQGASYGTQFAFLEDRATLERVVNVKLKEGDDTVVYNRRIDGFAFSYLINDPDFAITKEFEDLTGISTGMVRAHGIPAAQADSEIVAHYRALKGADGVSPAKIIFQAHNLPYDRGVTAANFQKLVSLMDDHLISDTAKIARQEKLAYDDTPVSSFSGLEGLPAKSYFYDSPYSYYSLSTFLQRASEGKGGVFPDTTAKLLLRYRPESEQFSLIDRVANREVSLPHTLADLLAARVPDRLPDNAVKFSVERMSSRAMIRNIMLLDKESPTKVSLKPHEQPHRSALELFQEKYHFDLTAEVNVTNFLSSIDRNTQGARLFEEIGKGGMLNLAERFLDENRELQAQFHDGWIYEKVLAVVEPDAKTVRIPEDVIEQVNYLTDLPHSKIREVLEATIRFKRKYGIEHALVHEEHNNIRQHSPDGHGLSDTAYEIVLPQMLTMLKRYNPYHQSVTTAVERLVEANVRGAMVQKEVGEALDSPLARDSFSMKQMLAFDRETPTDVVKKAQSMVKAPAAGEPLPEIKMSLPGEILPDNSAIYARPRRHLNQDEIQQAAKDLTFILINEQLRTAVEFTPNLSAGYSSNLLAFAQANDNKAIELRDRLMQDFESIVFERRDAAAKKAAELVGGMFDGVYKLPRTVTPELVELAKKMVSVHEGINRKLGRRTDSERVNEMLSDMQEKAEKWEITQERVAAKAAEASAAESADPDLVSPVRTPSFLPNLDIGRREPLKFVLEAAGVSVLLPFVHQQAEQLRPRRRPTP